MNIEQLSAVMSLNTDNGRANTLNVAVNIAPYQFCSGVPRSLVAGHPGCRLHSSRCPGVKKGNDCAWLQYEGCAACRSKQWDTGETT